MKAKWRLFRCSDRAAAKARRMLWLAREKGNRVLDMKPIRVFISYARENAVWLTEYLDPLRRNINPQCLLRQWQRTFADDNVTFWYDVSPEVGIQGGEDWLKRIFEEIDHADIAILLVTPQFVISPVVMSNEVPRILARQKLGEMEVLPILAQPTRPKPLEKFNFLNWAQGGPTPLSEYKEESESEFDKATNKILDSLESAIGRVRTRRALARTPQETPQGSPERNTTTGQPDPLSPEKRLAELRALGDRASAWSVGGQIDKALEGYQSQQRLASELSSSIFMVQALFGQAALLARRPETLPDALMKAKAAQGIAANHDDTRMYTVAINDLLQRIQSFIAKGKTG